MKYIIWDLDGTLLDSLQDLADAANYALREHGMAERSLDEVRRFVGNGVGMLIARAVPEGTSTEDTARVLQTFKDYYAQHCRDNTRPYDGIAETLRQLRARGVRMAVVSNKLQSAVSALHAEWFAENIEVAVGEREGVPRKPQPDMIWIAMEALGLSRTDTDKVTYVGDSEVDVQTARNAGVCCLSALWGFRSKEILLQAGASSLVAKPEDILAQ